jgi:hypothetical protein
MCAVVLQIVYMDDLCGTGLALAFGLRRLFFFFGFRLFLLLSGF